ncbi:hypothetical protein T4B_5269 [Trichinella pseudospiralis]|uniref:Uncharacterized protein n=1 Tax=Trichinella pseudospiralis TaxID=6337 RepID=A0A0V1IE24_TRIPS|nr:hypothetical protein T4A_12996 [Trichinella pseudospiralis]KRZ21070.1 hypothetical protein T4B_5269 [Trichinella pseudospiralis]KRZ42033.1 hypothetical protein T4C_2847 [Trichinella pseudospiralis]
MNGKEAEDEKELTFDTNSLLTSPPNQINNVMSNVGDENSNLSTIPLEYKVKRCISSSFKQTSANVLA